MPSSDPEFYITWLKWASDTAATLTTRIKSGQSSFAQLHRFLGDCLDITKALFDLWENVPRRGKPWQLIPRVARWLIANPDPLLEVRVRMRTMQKKWNEELAQK